MKLKRYNIDVTYTGIIKFYVVAENRKEAAWKGRNYSAIRRPLSSVVRSVKVTLKK